MNKIVCADITICVIKQSHAELPIYDAIVHWLAGWLADKRRTRKSSVQYKGGNFAVSSFASI